jgi:2-oxoglutarate dehydrogenase complex dehydrogenase (E1) component-like enzyme
VQRCVNFCVRNAARAERGLNAGQVYYTLLEERRKRGVKDIAISRVEQISPFPYDLVGNLDS